jgi:gentisate 1,2-dioxygenase
MSTYDNVMDYQNTVANYQKKGKVLIRSEDREWEITKQGRLKYYLEPNTHKDHALRDWMMFVNDVQTHSGSHKHQGGVVIFVLEGRGYTIVDGERWDWEMGDLICLPLKPGGVEHQHFNLDPGKPCRWLATTFFPFRTASITEFKQISVSPLYKDKG